MLPCPFCGDDCIAILQDVTHTHLGFGFTQTFEVKESVRTDCDGCGGSVSVNGKYRSEKEVTKATRHIREELIEKWNRRAQPATQHPATQEVAK